MSKTNMNFACNVGRPARQNHLKKPWVKPVVIDMDDVAAVEAGTLAVPEVTFPFTGNLGSS